MKKQKKLYISPETVLVVATSDDALLNVSMDKGSGNNTPEAKQAFLEMEDDDDEWLHSSLNLWDD